MSINSYTSPVLSVPHVFCGRNGGVSSGKFASLNCSSSVGDDEVAVRHNCELVSARFFNQYPLILNQQQHTNQVRFVQEIDANSRVIADALVTQQPGCALGVLTADCTAILLHDPTSNMVAAAHGGWRGLMSGIIANTICCMINHGATANKIQAVIGPCIHQPSYEVGPEVLSEITNTGGKDLAQFFQPAARPQRWQFDLPGCARHLLARDGVAITAILPYDTYSAPELFFSFRYTTVHANHNLTGRQLAAISLGG